MGAHERPLRWKVYSFAHLGTELFAGLDGGVFRSTDNGVRWTAVNAGLTKPVVTALLATGNNLFAATNGGGVFLSTDHGTTWAAVNDGLGNNVLIFSLAVIPDGVGGTTLFAGTAGDGVYRSTDNGTTWTAANAGMSGVNGAYVYALAVTF